MSATVCEQCGKRVSKSNVNIHGICSLCVAHNNAASALKGPEKKCTKCGEVKSVSEFGPQKAGKFGVHSHCKACKAMLQRERRNRNGKMSRNIKIIEKTCGTCKLTKPVSYFWMDKGNPDGLQSRCISCSREAKKQASKSKQEKKCTKCGIRKSVTEFSKNKTTPDGLQYHCKSCHSEYLRRSYENLKSQQKINIEQKQCRKCKKVKLRNEFYGDTSKEDGKCTQCKQCMNEGQHRRRQHLKEIAKHEAMKPKNTANLHATTRSKTAINSSKQETVNAVKEAKLIKSTPIEQQPKTNWNIHIPYIVIIAVMALITVLNLTQTAQ